MNKLERVYIFRILKPQNNQQKEVKAGQKAKSKIPMNFFQVKIRHDKSHGRNYKLNWKQQLI